MWQLSMCEFSLVQGSKSTDSESPSAALLSEAQLQLRGEFEWCLSESGWGEDGTGQSRLNSFALYLFTAEDLLAQGSHLVPVSENSSSSVCWEKLESPTKYLGTVWSLLEAKDLVIVGLSLTRGQKAEVKDEFLKKYRVLDNSQIWEWLLMVIVSVC